MSNENLKPLESLEKAQMLLAQSKDVLSYIAAALDVDALHGVSQLLELAANNLSDAESELRTKETVLHAVAI